MLSPEKVKDRIKDIWRVKLQFELLELVGAPIDNIYLSAGAVTVILLLVLKVRQACCYYYLDVILLNLKYLQNSTKYLQILWRW